MKLSFRKKTNAEWAVLFAMFFPFLFYVLIDLLHVPSVVKYFIDVAWLFLLCAMLISRMALSNYSVAHLAKLVGAFFALSLIGVFSHPQSVLYYLWGLRNNARFFVYFFACILFINKKSVEHYLDFFEKLFWLNFPVVLYQYFALGFSGDFLGGIFGVEKGCNSYMNIFMLIVASRTILKYMHYKINLSKCIAVVGVALVVAILSELKVFILELVVVILMAAVMTQFSLRKLWICVAGMVGILIAGQAIAVLFPDFAEWFSFEGIWKMLSNKSGYTLQNDFNRLSAVPRALKVYLPSLWEKLFGLGLGNCDYSAFDFLITPFYRKNAWTSYMWFSSSFIILETGLVGLVTYILFFVVLFFGIHKREKMAGEHVVNCQLAKIMTAMCFVLIIYNASLRTEAAYMLYFVLALPFVEDKIYKQKSMWFDNRKKGGKYR